MISPQEWGGSFAHLPLNDFQNLLQSTSESGSQHSQVQSHMVRYFNPAKMFPGAGYLFIANIGNQHLVGGKDQGSCLHQTQRAVNGLLGC